MVSEDGKTKFSKQCQYMAQLAAGGENFEKTHSLKLCPDIALANRYFEIGNIVVYTLFYIRTSNLAVSVSFLILG